jgi:hypothetical protein
MEENMSGTDWLPRKEHELVDLCQKWAAALGEGAKITAYGWNPAECTAVLNQVNAFLVARGAYEDEDTSANRLAKDEAKGEAVDAMRGFANASIRFNSRMDDTAKLALGIHPKDTTPTPHGRPTNQPETVVEPTHNHYEHLVRAINPERGDHSKPEDAYGVRYAWQIGGERPASGADLPKAQFTRKTFLVVQHTEAEKGKKVYYAACYENSKGETGPWSTVVEGFIS